MGPGVAYISRVHSSDTNVITATWPDGRIGTIRLIHDSGYGSVTFMEGGHADNNNNLNAGYGPLLEQIVTFISTGKSPVPESETLEIFAGMDAATRSLQQGSTPIPLTAPGDKAAQ
jgi:hypothetical protein